MQASEPQLLLLNGKLVDDLYVEAMVLADEARAYLENCAIDRMPLAPMERVNFSCESLKVTTRLMQVIAWLLSQRAYMRGEISAEECRSAQYRLGDAAASELAVTRSFPSEMRMLIATSESLYQRALRLEEQIIDGIFAAIPAGHSPARDLIHRLETSF